MLRTHNPVNLNLLWYYTYIFLQSFGWTLKNIFGKMFQDWKRKITELVADLVYIPVKPVFFVRYARCRKANFPELLRQGILLRIVVRMTSSHFPKYNGKHYRNRKNSQIVNENDHYTYLFVGERLYMWTSHFFLAMQG